MDGFLLRFTVHYRGRIGVSDLALYRYVSYVQGQGMLGYMM